MTQQTPRNYNFTSAELDRVEDALALVLEDSCWHGEELYVPPYKLMKQLRLHGHTRAKIIATLERLVERGVLETPFPETVMYDLEIGSAWEVNRQNYFTTRTRWLAYLAENSRVNKPSKTTGPASTSFRVEMIPRQTGRRRSRAFGHKLTDEKH